MVDGIQNRPLYFYQKDIIGWDISCNPTAGPGANSGSKKDFGQKIT